MIEFKPVQYQIEFWSGIVDLKDWAWASLVSDLILIWRYRPKRLSLSQLSVWSDIARWEVQVWAISVSNLNLI